jgi:hypothetical protein
MKNLLYAVGMIVAGALLLMIILPVEMIDEIKWRRENR